MLNVTPIPAFNDNYIWAITIAGSTRVAVVDPGDAVPVEDYLSRHALELCAILVTHHHQDHTGGIDALVARYDVPVYGPAQSPFKGVTHPLHDGDSLELFGHTLEIKQIPGHTLDHISYFSPSDTPQIFCGDTLFLAGCGRIFEGTAQQMYAAMRYFLSLPDATEVYCTHEYSLANLAFAKAVEPDNAAITQVTEQCQALRDNAKPTLPTTIAQERRINPFLRSDQPDVIAAAQKFCGRDLGSEAEVFAATREWKNQF